MKRMARCAACGGFVPGARHCPNCGMARGAAARTAGVVKAVVAVGLGVATSITLMACYGPPVVRTDDSGPPPTPGAAARPAAAADGAGAAPTTTATGSAKP